MESLVFDASATSDRQCVNITILNDDERESPTFRPLAETFRVRLNVSNDVVQVETQTAFVSIEDDDCKLDCTFFPVGFTQTDCIAHSHCSLIVYKCIWVLILFTSSFASSNSFMSFVKEVTFSRQPNE